MSTGTPGSEPEKDPPSARTTAHLGKVEPSQLFAAPAIDAGAKAAVEALPPGSALLILQHGPDAGARFLLETARVTAGRHPKADIFLDDITVSRRHCEFLGNSGAFTVRDLGSLNGTYVNRTRVDEIVLRVGDEVQIGKFRFIFYPSPNEANSTPAVHI